MLGEVRGNWRDIPWLTLSLFGIIWSIHIASRALGIQAEVRNSYGLASGIYLTYFTHAFLHADLFHIISNSVSLLIFGSVVESQISRAKFLIIVLVGILAGGTFAMSYPHSAEFYPGEPPVG